MKYIILLLIIILFSFIPGCDQARKPIEKEWLGRMIDFYSIEEDTRVYYMYDSTNTKVGSMIYGGVFEAGKYIARDTSQFDNGSVYETAEFVLDTTEFVINELKIDMITNQLTLDIDLTLREDLLSGTYSITRDSTRTFVIDTTFNFTLFRSELYMLLQTLRLNMGDTLEFKALVPTSMSISNSMIFYERRETIVTPVGRFDCDVIWLKSDGLMPENIIWISRETPRKLIKFYVPGPELSIELVSINSS